MHIISIDLEMNQPSSTIIELGYTIANAKNKEIKLVKSILINPNEQLNPEIIELTKITQDMVDKGVSLVEAYNIMVEDINHYQCTKTAVEWSVDHFELRNQLGLKWSDYIFDVRCLDIKSLYQMYAMRIPNGKTVAGLQKALSILGQPFHGQPHRADADSYNTMIAYFILTDKMLKHDRVKKVMEEK